MLTFFEKMFIRLIFNKLEWPENSPDLNPIENFGLFVSKTSYNKLYLERKADSGSNSSVVQGSPNLKRLFKVGRLDVQAHQNAS